ncbi:MAG: flagellar biosynthesis protein FlhA [Acidimicrobiia bacterium]|nr:flagellar biosynthesis protein FlhA [Acidimicrobiia bacterium]
MTAPVIKRRRISQLGIPFMIVSIVVVMVVPMPALLIDIMIALNIAIALVAMLTSMIVDEPLEFSVFPALLLVTTLFRLALNISTTRLILSEGEGGAVIETFGGFVVGGNIVIGLVIFLILVVIQFAVVTSGAGRVAEVSARFTLDAMPGKQMAIDAELNAGSITELEATQRRKTVSREADFYGSMDGASKFVKGDAIASVVIVVINLLGGITIGVLQQGLSVSESVQRFALLSVGDGLVSQIPALLISVASGIIVTRAITDVGGGLGGDLFAQLLQDRRVLGVAAAAMTVVGLMPGIPRLPFLVMSIAMATAALRAADPDNPSADPSAPAGRPSTGSAEEDLFVDIRVEPLEIVLAPDLFDLVDPDSGGTLLSRVSSLRRKIAMEYGLVIPLVRTRDDSSLDRSTYVIKLNGVEAGRGDLPPGQSLVLVPGDDLALQGTVTVDPVFGLPAAWVSSDVAEVQARQGKTVIDRASVMVTHVSEIVVSRADEILSRQAVQELVEGVAATSPAVANEVGGDVLTLAELHDVLRALLRERVPIRDLTRILEAVTARARTSREPDALLEAARTALAAVLTSQITVDGVLRPITIDPLLEQQMIEAVRTGEAGAFLALEPGLTEAFLAAADEQVLAAERVGHEPVIVCSASLRPVILKLLLAGRPGLRVLSFAELSPGPSIEPLGVISVATENV